MMKLVPIIIMIAYAVLAFMPLFMTFDVDNLIEGPRDER